MEPENTNVSFSFVDAPQTTNPSVSMWMKAWSKVLKETSQDMPVYEIDVVLMDDGIAGGTIENLGPGEHGIATEFLSNSPAVLWMQIHKDRIQIDHLYHLVLRFNAWPSARPEQGEQINIRLNLLEEKFEEIDMERAMELMATYEAVNESTTEGEVHPNHQTD